MISGRGKKRFGLSKPFPKAPKGSAVKDSGVVKIGVSLKWMIMKKARLPHVVCGLKTAQPRRESGDVTEDKRGGQRQ